MPKNAEAVIKSKTMRIEYLESELELAQSLVGKCDHEYENEAVLLIVANHQVQLVVYGP